MRKVFVKILLMWLTNVDPLTGNSYSKFRELLENPTGQSAAKRARNSVNVQRLEYGVQTGR